MNWPKKFFKKDDKDKYYEERQNNRNENYEFKVQSKDIEKRKIEHIQNEGFLDTRLGWNKIFGHRIPKHANDPTYTLGGMIIFLGIVQVITGVILQQFYIPHSIAPGAYESVVQIAKNVDLSFVRNLHYWGAQFLLIIALLHMTRVFISGAYKKPRELQWLTGVVLLVIIIAFSYTGTVLKGDQEAIEAFGHQLETGKISGPLNSILTLQFIPNISSLTRLFALHVTVIPLLSIPVLAIHLILIRLNNIAIPKVKQNNKIVSIVGEGTSFSSHMVRIFEYGAAVTVLAIILSLMSPAPLYQRGIEGIEITKPPWYLIWLYPLEDIFGIKAIAGTSILMFVILAAVPLVDRKEITDPRRRKIMIVGMFVLIIVFSSLLIAGSASPVVHHHM